MQFTFILEKNMRINITKKRCHPEFMLAILFSILILLPSAGVAQRSSKAQVQKKIPKSAGSVIGKLNVNATLAPGVGEIALENYSGSSLKAIQFRIIATSMTQLESVLPGSSIFDIKLYSFHHMVFPGTPDAFGKRADTIRVVIFGNGKTVIPLGASVKLLVMNYQKPNVAGTSADTVTFKVMDVMGALPPPRVEAARIEPGPEVSLNLWK
jgi:hypothetical protein